MDKPPFAKHHTSVRKQKVKGIILHNQQINYGCDKETLMRKYEDDQHENRGI